MKSKLSTVLSVLVSVLMLSVSSSSFSAPLTLTGDWTVNGSLAATLFSGNGSGLTDVIASGLGCTNCIGTAQINPSQVQSRVTGSCGPGQYLQAVNQDGNVACASAPGSGSVTQINTGEGLTGGPITTSGTVSVDFAGTGTAPTVARSDHDHAGLYAGKSANVVIVAKSGGDFTDPVPAINSITDASASNPYLVKIMPGVYESNITMKPYVDVEGSGEYTTTLRKVVGAINAELRNLTAELSIQAPDSYPYCVVSAPSRMTNVTVKLYATAEMYNFDGIDITQPAVLNNVNCSISGTWGIQSFAIHIEDNATGVVLNNITINANTVTAGIMNCGNVKMTNSTTVITGQGWEYQGGITSGGYVCYNNNPLTEVINSTVLNLDASPHTVVRAAYGKTLINNSELVGPIVKTNGALTCLNAFNGNYTAITCP